MIYVPAGMENLPEYGSLDLVDTDQKIIVRNFKVSRMKRQGDRLLLISDDTDRTISIQFQRVMIFGDKPIEANKYALQVLESGDIIDAVIEGRSNSEFYAEMYWIQIRYRGARPKNLVFKEKEPGLFAWRTKSGEKGERKVARQLMDKYHHVFDKSRVESPGFFEIFYEGKKQRKPDLVCERCGLRFEVKKRNRDNLFRVSHSEKRSLIRENKEDGWHVFVFPDKSIHYLSNQTIIKEIKAGRAKLGQDEHDAWADIDVRAEAAPRCMGPDNEA